VVDRDRLRPVELADARERVVDELGLGADLRLVRDVLVVAAAALAEVAASRVDAVRSGLEDLDDLGPQEGLLHLRDLHAHKLLGRRQRDEDSHALMARDRRAAKREPLGAEVEDRSWFGRSFSRRVAHGRGGEVSVGGPGREIGGRERRGSVRPSACALSTP
jgi:hypothetical protein